MKLKSIKFIFITAVLIIGWLGFGLWRSNNYLQAHFLNIGQGTAVLIRTQSGVNILVDAGPDNLLLAELGEVLHWWDRRLDYVIISHHHADHIGGLIELARRYQIGEVLTTDHHPDQDLLYGLWQAEISKHQIKVTEVEVGASWQVGENLSWQILSADDYHEEYNDNSLVLRLTYGQIDWLFPGDLTSAKELDVLLAGWPLAAEILNVGHHGSKYSSSLEWLRAIQPKLCIIQSGLGNKFGHPHQEAINRLNQVGCQVWRNDQQGKITTWSYGQDYWVKSE